jgi:acyl-CoA synthetase (AMP-forming)/AMP-acid ligase II
VRLEAWQIATICVTFCYAALIDAASGKQVTFLEFREAVNTLAGAVLKRGYTGVLAIMAPNSLEFCVAWHGIATAGLTVTSINPSYVVEEIRHQMHDSQATVMFTIGAFVEKIRAAVSSAVKEIITFDDAPGTTPFSSLLADTSVRVSAQVPVDAATHVCVIPYSSGTTGLSKGVMLTHRNLVANIVQTLTSIDITPTDRVIAFLPFFHVYVSRRGERQECVFTNHAHTRAPYRACRCA